MVMNPYETLLKELEEVLEVGRLKPDKNNTCLISLKNGLNIHIEPFQDEHYFLLTTNLGTIPPGPYRTDVFKEALKANAFPQPRFGTFAFSEDQQQLVLFKLFPYHEITGEQLASYLEHFMERALKWKEHLDRGDVPLAETLAQSGRGPRPSSGIFGL